MKIDSYIDEFLKKSFYGNKALKKYATDLLKGNNANSLPRMDGYDGSTNLKDSIRDSVKATMRAKDSAISVYKDFLAFLSKKGINIEIKFPPVPIDSSFERQMYIAKYLQSEDAKVEDLEDKLWVSDRTIEEDLRRLYRGSDDPIQICGRPFFIPDSERHKGKILSASTVHLFNCTDNVA